MEKEETLIFGPITESDFIASMTISDFIKNTNVLRTLIKELLLRFPDRYENEIAKSDFYIGQLFRQYKSNKLLRTTKFKRIRYVSKSLTNFNTHQVFLNPHQLVLEKRINKNAFIETFKRCLKFVPNSIPYEDFVTFSNIRIFIKKILGSKQLQYNFDRISRKIYDDFMIKKNQIPSGLKFKSDYIYWNFIPKQYQKYFDKDMQPKTDCDNNCETPNAGIQLNSINANESVANVFRKDNRNNTEAPNLAEKDLQTSAKIELETKTTFTTDNIHMKYSFSSVNNVVDKNKTYLVTSDMSFKNHIDASISNELLQENESLDNNVQFIEYFDEPNVTKTTEMSNELAYVRKELIKCYTLDITRENKPKSLYDLGFVEANESIDQIQNNNANIKTVFEVNINKAGNKPQIKLKNIVSQGIDIHYEEIMNDCDTSEEQDQDKSYFIPIQNSKEHTSSSNSIQITNSQNLYTSLLNHDSTFFNFTEPTEQLNSYKNILTPKELIQHNTLSSLVYPSARINIFDLSSFTLQLRSRGQSEVKVNIGPKNTYNNIVIVCGDQVRSIFNYTDNQWADVNNIINFIRIFNYNGNPPNPESHLAYKILYYLFKTHSRISKTTLLCQNFNFAKVVKNHKNVSPPTIPPINPEILKAMEALKSNDL